MFFVSLKPNLHINLTNNAWKKINKLVNNNYNNCNIFLFYSTSGIHNGFNNKLNLLHLKNSNKIYNNYETTINSTIIEKNNIKIIIDPISEIILSGNTIDYIDNNKNFILL